MAVINTNLTCDLQSAVKVQYLGGNLFSQDVQGNVINVAVFDNGEPAEITGDVTASIIRADGETVAATGGTISENVASITLPAAAYAVPGVISIVVKLSASGVITTIAAVVSNVYQSATDVTVDPGTIIPSIQTLISEINAAVASIPADYSALWTTIAPAFSSSASYNPGQYVTYNGGLYLCTSAHSGSWNSAHFTSTNVGGELSNLKSAIAFNSNNIGISLHREWLPGYIATNVTTIHIDTVVQSSGWYHQVFECVPGDTFHVKVTSASSTARPWAWAKSDGTKISSASANGVDVDIIAPAEAAYLVTNTKGTLSSNYITKGISRIEKLEKNHENVMTEFQDELGIVIMENWNEGKYIDTSVSSVNIENLVSNSSFSCIVIPCAQDDHFVVDVNGSTGAWPWVFIDSTGAKLNSKPDNSQYNVSIAAPANSAYLVCNTNNSHRKVYKGTSNMKNAQSEISSINDTVLLMTSGKKDIIPDLTDNYYVIYTNGNTDSNSNFHCTGFIGVPIGAETIITNFHNSSGGDDGYAFYNGNMEFISGGKCSQASETTIAVPENARYIRLSGRKSYEETGVDRFVSIIASTGEKANNGYTVVMLGDSIIGNYNGDDSVPSFLSRFSGATCYNCAFGGSSMGTDTYGSSDPLMMPFRGFKVIESIVSNDYTDMETAAASLADYYSAHIDTLKGMDWTKVDIITLSYGINDWLTEVTLEDNPENAKDTDTIGGALRAALETLWGTYPNIKVMICGPTWLGGTISGGEINWDSDNHTNDIGKYLEQYSEKEANVAKEYHVPFLEMYNNTNFNRYTWKRYFPTNGSNAIHPNATGRYVIAKRYAWMLAQY